MSSKYFESYHLAMKYRSNNDLKQTPIKKKVWLMGSWSLVWALEI